MVLPFALAPDGGSYTLFIFLLLSIALSYHHPHCVQLSAAARVNSVFNNNFRGCSIDFDLTAGHVSMLLHDADNATTTAIATTSTRRVWDPGIALALACFDDVHSRVMIDVAGPSNVNVTRRRRRQWDPGITKHSKNGSLHASIGSMSPIASRQQQWDPGIPKHSKNVSTAYASVGWQSLFHYSHPVLSRPTVPNINT